jgi:protein O-GlcNAc transferase
MGGVVGAAEEAFQNAMKSMSGNRPADAVAFFKKALALKPGLAEAWHGQGNAFVQLKRYDEAFAAYDRAIALKPALAGPWLGHLFANLGRHKEALAAYDRALTVKPGLAEAWLGRCHSLVQLKRYDEALAAYDRALAVEPGTASAWLGHLLAGLERNSEALAAYDKTLAIKADLADAWLGRGNVLIKLKRLDDALVAYGKGLALRPDAAEAWLGQGNLLTEIRRYDEASAAFDRTLALKPSLAEAWLGRGNLLVKLNRRDEAVAAYEKALALKPGLVEAWLSLGNVLTELERHSEALTACDRALALQPDMPDAWLGRGYSFIKMGRYDEALAAYDKALALRPGLAEARLGRGNVFFKRERYEEALAAYDDALLIQPRSAEAWLGRGNVFFRQDRHEDALAAYEKALALRPESADAWLGRANALTELDRSEDALAACEKALALKPDLPEAWLARGNLFTRSRHADEALAAYDRALAFKPRLAEAWLGRGNLFSELFRYDESLACYDKALEFKPDLAEAWLGRGDLLTTMGRHDRAILDCDRGLALKPGLIGLAGLRLRAKQSICDWKNLEADCNHLLESAMANELSVDPFVFLSLASSGSNQLDHARRWIGKRHPPFKTPVWTGEVYKHDRIRIGYVSSDFQEHATAYLLAGVFENHDKSAFDVTAISTGPRDNSPMRRRLMDAFESFVDAAGLSDAEVAQKIRSAEIDILVDLKGFTKDARVNIFARRPAPIQVNYLGYPGTMGADYIDYIIADPTVVPASAQSAFSEKLAYLPDSYQANDSSREISETRRTREECNLPGTGFVFCCFNNNYKITPDVYDSWMRILKNVQGSVLWLFESGSIAAANLKKEAELRGVRAERIIFARRMPLPDHLSRHRLADLFLDTSPYNAHTTASDALWAGLPVLTQIGETFAARVAASLLNAVGLPELIAHNSEDYERRAIDIASHPEKLRALRDKLAENRARKPLFDTKLITRQIEAAYTAMYARYQAGLAPEMIVVPN